MFVDWIADPVDPWVITYGGMGRINQNDLKVLVGGVLQWKREVKALALISMGKQINSIELITNITPFYKLKRIINTLDFQHFNQ